MGQGKKIIIQKFTMSLCFWVVMLCGLLVNGKVVKAATSGDYEYTVLSDGTVEITKYTGDAVIVYISNTIDGKKVTSIGENAFLGCGLVELTIAEGITNIGWGAFASCTNLKIVHMPDSITKIYVAAFGGCSSLVTINIPDSVVEIGVAAFNGCDSLKTINIPSKVEHIGDLAFSDCDNLESITVESENRYYCSVNGVLYNKEKDYLICYPPKLSQTYYEIPESVKTMGGSAFFKCNNLKQVSIPNGVEEISGDMFKDCKNLEEIKIPDSVQIIWTGAFSGCISLKDINLPKNLRYIFPSAFSYCINLTTIKIPDGTWDIGSAAFSNCSSLITIDIPNTVNQIADDAFFNCINLILTVSKGSYAEQYAIDNIIPYQYPESSEVITPGGSQDTSQEDEDQMETPTDPQPDMEQTETPTTPTGGAAQQPVKKGLKVEVSKATYTVTDTKNATVTYTTSSNKSATTVSVPATVKIQGKTYKVTKIADNAFKNNKKLKKVKIGKNIITIGKNAFKGCTKLKKLTMGQNVVTIGNSAFEGCTKLAQVTIPKNVATIGSKAFYNCKKLNKITVKSMKLKKIGKAAFKGIVKNTTVKAPKAKIGQYQKLFKGRM